MKTRKKQTKKSWTEYKAFFTMGISFIALGLVLSTVIHVGFLGIAVLGIIYLMISLKNRDKWEKK